ncbi:hypothetical protein FJZ27_02635 [Candidatus Peribacteria bacterium]|nr:hypothetical protein [Candidatus Peribacteria bacterium]
MLNPSTLSTKELHALIAPVEEKEFLVGSNDRPDRVIRNNTIFNDVVQQGSTVCSLLAAIRWKLLHLGRKQYSQETGIDRSTIKVMERASHAHTLDWRYTTVHALLDYWRQHHAIVTKEHVQTAIDAILGRRKGTIEGLYMEYEYRYGKGAVESNRGTTLDAVRAYRDKPYIPPFAPLLRIAVAKENCDETFTIERLQSVWASEARSILTEKRGVPPSLAELHVQAELQQSDLLSSRKMLRNTKPTPATLISRFKMTPWEDAQGIARSFINADDLADFREQWTRDFAKESGRPDFHTELLRMQHHRGFSDLKMKRILGAEGTSPSMLMRDPIIEGKSDTNTEAPPAVLAHIVGSTQGEIRALIRTFRENRSLWRRRMGYPTFDNPVRLEREQWGITNGVLSRTLNSKPAKNDAEIWGDALPAITALRKERKHWPQQILMRAENEQSHLSCTSPHNTRREEILQGHLRTVINHLGMQRARTAIEHRDSYTAPRSITEAMVRMAEDAADARRAHKPREFGPLHRLAKEQSVIADPSIRAYCTAFHIRRYADGIEVPSLPVLQHLLGSGGVVDKRACKALEKDWAERFALQLQGKLVVPPEIEAQYPALHPIPKWIMQPRKHAPLSAAILHCIGRVGTSMSRFARDRMPASSAADSLTQMIKLIDSSTTVAPEKLPCTLPEILLAADIGKGTLQWGWVHLLLNNRGRKRAAFRAWKQRFPQAAMTPWNLPGLTTQDIAILQKNL